MTRTVRKTNIRVVIEPRREGDYGFIILSPRNRTPESEERYGMAEAERIVSEVKRHVDDFSDVRIKFDQQTFCSTSEWTVDDEGNSLGRWPACCGTDQYDFFKEHESESDEWFAERGMDDPAYLAEFRAGDHVPTDQEGEQ